MIGITLKNRYRIYDRLGSGGSATVYLARNSESGQMVIVKVMHNNAVDEQFTTRFSREIDLLRQLDSPNVIGLYDWALQEYDTNVDEYISYIVAEFVEGHTLATLIDTRGAFSERDALTLTRQLASGLAVIHSKGIIHRDIKSQNVMVTPQRLAKIIDFGIAKSAGHTTITGPSNFAGTLHYASPEQILEARDVDHRTDIYALGIVLYEMLMGKLPIRDREFGVIAGRIINGDLDPLVGVSPETAELVSEMLARSVDERISSARTVITRIEEILGGAEEPIMADLPDTSVMKLMFSREEARESFPTFLLTERGQRIPLNRPSLIVGRSHPSDATIPDIDLWQLGLENARTASRRHCRIFLSGDTYYIEDLESMNGTRLNDHPLEAGSVYKLKPGDQITVGRVLLTFSQ